MAEVLGTDRAGIARAAALLRAGGLVAFPTETVYGLGAPALWAEAVAKVFAAKGRPRFDPVIVHVADPGEAERLWREVPALARALMERFWPGPLTLVLPKRDIVPDIVTAGLPTVAVRMPAHPVALALIREAGVPIAAPSANRFGRLSPTHHEAVLEQLGEAIDAVIAGGPTPVGIESTVISLAESPPRLLRPGGTPIEALRELLPDLRLDPPRGPSASPGTLPQHYRPATPLFLWEPGPPEGGEALERHRCGFLAFRKPWEGFAQVEVLSERGDLVEAAARFFALLHRLDQAGLAAIVAEPVPEVGLGLAIMDRLRRASSGRARLDETRVWIAR
ncbi:MAG: L-threonylcarbamoyladenylate synthase [Candidatus Bipolaricaulota bacterium]|nr:L-threonylcarbamoyladenylate synthase [Candidatus Bipolaricaulota bacterium]MDW8151936.1 L-threonylcarbamoyladenylate synthase [Candidatus Bipolaricaulota bacterium]